MTFIFRAVLTLIVLAALRPDSLKAQDADEKLQAEVKANYTKYEYRIPMRNGKRLFTAVYMPKDQSSAHPILLQRTPYSVRPYGVDQYPEGLQPFALFGKGGYIFVYQDVRGRWMSEGEFVQMRPHNPNKTPLDIDESTDAYDTIDWLLKHVHGHNGRVGLWGVSYPGFYAAAGMIDAHPALKAVSPQAPQVDWFMGDDWHHNGALLAMNMLNFMAIIDRPHPAPTKNPASRAFVYDTPDGYDFCLKLGPLNEVGKRYLKGESRFWDEAIQHETYDAFWRRQPSAAPKEHQASGDDCWRLVRCREPFWRFGSVQERHRRTPPKTDNLLVMGPWFHGGWIRDDGSKLGTWHLTRNQRIFTAARSSCRSSNTTLRARAREAPGAWVFETGVNRWRGTTPGRRRTRRIGRSFSLTAAG